MEKTKLFRKEERKSQALSYLINNLFEANNLEECLDIAIKGLSMLGHFQNQIALKEDGYFVVKRNHMERKMQFLLEKVSDLKFMEHRVDIKVPFASHLANSRTIATVDVEGTTKVDLYDVVKGYLPRDMDSKMRISMAKRVVSLLAKRTDLVMMPINYQGRVIGAIGISGSSIKHDDILFMKNLCEIFAQSFEKTQINEALKKTHKELKRSEARFRNLANLLPQTVFEIDERGNFMFSNRMGFEITGYTQEDLDVGLNALQLFIPEERDRVKENIQKVLSGEEQRGNEYTALRKDGSTFPVIIYSSPIIRQNKPVGLRGIVVDITERKRMEEELKRYSGLLEDMVWEKTKQLKEVERMAAIGETAAMVGHDLRNPLQVLTNLHYLAKKTLNSAKDPIRDFAKEKGWMEMLGTIKEQVDYMDKIASDLQDYARPIEPKPVPTSLYRLVNDTLSTMTFPKTVEVSIVIAEDLPKLVIDPALMKRVFSNLISNALQAMPDGGKLTIKASRTRDEASISVEDTGLGIHEENLDKIFSPLFTTKSKGQGFGLAVANRMVEAHGGSISVESEVDRGSTFTIRIPLRREAT